MYNKSANKIEIFSKITKIKIYFINYLLVVQKWKWEIYDISRNYYTLLCAINNSLKSKKISISLISNYLFLKKIVTKQAEEQAISFININSGIISKTNFILFWD